MSGRSGHSSQRRFRAPIGILTVGCDTRPGALRALWVRASVVAARVRSATADIASREQPSGVGRDEVVRAVTSHLAFSEWNGRVGALVARGMDDNTLERNRRNVVAFYDLMFNDCRPAEAIERFAGHEYRQHNPHVADGKQAFIDYFERMAAEYPGKRVEFKRSIAEGDLVVLHCHQIWPEGLEYAGIDIFRLDPDGKVVEHWDVLARAP